MVKTITESVFEGFAERPQAYAALLGGREYPKIQGFVLFFAFDGGTVVSADVIGLPSSGEACKKGIFGFHIHAGDGCGQVMQEGSPRGGSPGGEFSETGLHYNPLSCEHPNHAGDMPVLFENNGRAWMAFYTDRFTPEEIIGRTVVIHNMPDDFRTNPAGDSGMKIACGVVDAM